MKLGVVFPQMEIGDDVSVIREYALGVEDAGYEFLVAYDHVLGHRPAVPVEWQETGPYTDKHAFHEVFVLFAYLAAITSTLEFATEVLVLPQRQTALVAKQAAELHLLSDGRLSRLGVGVGWNPEEYRALGMDFHHRGRRVAEQIQVLRRLWSEDVITFHGKYHSIESAGLRPRPPLPEIQIWIGGSADVALRRAAAIADGFVLDHELVQAPAVVNALNRQLDEQGRDHAAFGLAARVRLGGGGSATAVQEAQAWQKMGVTHLSVNTMSQGVGDPEQHLQRVLGFMNAWRGVGGAGSSQ